jgi:hypothetical protein
MRMPGFSAEVALYKRSVHFKLENVQPAENSNAPAVPAQIFDPNIVPAPGSLSACVWMGRYECDRMHCSNTYPYTCKCEEGHFVMEKHCAGRTT